ncbi:jg18985 [Pararge aegeria aegeria]|uniref:Jg18985 protein n=1 Tax=Pararge aegeria aegeria TaxID=348720 RepID=A0A8S4RCH4_9NEOP|nr:jg18985 [Pararge aegeria aegeria]
MYTKTHSARRPGRPELTLEVSRCIGAYARAYAAFTSAGLPFQHLGTPTSIPPANYVPRPLPLQLRVDPRRGGRTTLGASQGAAGFKVQNRGTWNSLQKIYVQQWTSIGGYDDIDERHCIWLYLYY